MENSEAKIIISLKEGKFELHGSENFVSSQIENLKELISQSLKDNSVESDFQTNLKHIEIVDQSPISVDKISAVLDDKYSDIFVIDDDNIKIITDIPGSSASAKTLNTALLYSYAKKLQGYEESNVDEIRKICENHGFLDSKNFSQHIKSGDPKLYLDKGKANNRILKLNRPGEKKAEELINQLLENAK